MSRTDLIADAFTIMRNAIMTKKESVDIPASNTLKSVMDILKREGYVENFKIIDDSKQGLIRIYLRYLGGEPAIKNIKRVSRPGLRIYAKRGNVPLVLKGRGLAMVSTSKGVITDKEAREQHLGGEIIGYIW